MIGKLVLEIHLLKTDLQLLKAPKTSGASARPMPRTPNVPEMAAARGDPLSTSNIFFLLENQII